MCSLNLYSKISAIPYMLTIFLMLLIALSIGKDKLWSVSEFIQYGHEHWHLFVATILIYALFDTIPMLVGKYLFVLKISKDDISIKFIEFIIKVFIAKI